MSALDLWIKSAHIISVIAWMATLLYLPRLFVYHSESVVGSEKSETFKVMERRLLKIIATPAMFSTWVFGIWLAARYGVLWQPWFLIKFLFVVGLTLIHFMCAKYAKAFLNDENLNSSRFFRILNEVPAVIMIIIVVLVVVKPF